IAVQRKANLPGGGPRLERPPGGASGSWSSRFFCLYFSYIASTSGSLDISHSPVVSRITRDFASFTKAGRTRSCTKKLKKRKATTTIIRPRASPKRKPNDL